MTTLVVLCLFTYIFQNLFHWLLLMQTCLKWSLTGTLSGRIFSARIVFTWSLNNGCAVVCRTRAFSIRTSCWSRSYSRPSLSTWYAQLPACARHCTPSELIQHTARALSAHWSHSWSEPHCSVLSYVVPWLLFTIASCCSLQVFLIGGISVSCVLIFSYGRRELLLGAFAAACFGMTRRFFLLEFLFGNFWVTCVTGTVTVLSAKAVSGLLRLTFSGNIQIASALFWIALILLCLGAVFQVLYDYW